MEFTFSLYAADASLHPANLEELPKEIVAEYRRGVPGCEISPGKLIAPGAFRFPAQPCAGSWTSVSKA
jgi:hypothetical protein